MLSLVLGASGLGKLLGWQAGFVLPAVMHYGLACIEIVLIGLLWSRYARWAVAGVLAIALGGVGVATLLRPADCGCFGPLAALGWREHLWLACGTGSVACVAWGLRGFESPGHP